jgi:predicted DsbA family dithiol-disulfide isomerase
MSKNTIQVVIDFICPWSFIAKHSIDQALEKIENSSDLVIEWQSFQLNPDMPMEGMDRKVYRTQKFGSWENSLQREAKAIEVGTSLGIDFNFRGIIRTPNTTHAHRLMWFVQQDEPQKTNEVVERLFSAYFLEGKDIGQIEVLLDIGISSGLNESRLKTKWLKEQAGLSEITTQQKNLMKQGVSGVPFMYVPSQRLALPGFHRTNTIHDFFLKILNNNQASSSQGEVS